MARLKPDVADAQDLVTKRGGAPTVLSRLNKVKMSVLRFTERVKGVRDEIFDVLDAPTALSRLSVYSVAMPHQARQEDENEEGAAVTDTATDSGSDDGAEGKSGGGTASDGGSSPSPPPAKAGSKATPGGAAKPQVEAVKGKEGGTVGKAGKALRPHQTAAAKPSAAALSPLRLPQGSAAATGGSIDKDRHTGRPQRHSPVPGKAPWRGSGGTSGLRSPSASFHSKGKGRQLGGASGKGNSGGRFVASDSDDREVRKQGSRALPKPQQGEGSSEEGFGFLPRVGSGSSEGDEEEEEEEEEWRRRGQRAPQPRGVVTPPPQVLLPQQLPQRFRSPSQGQEAAMKRPQHRRKARRNRQRHGNNEGRDSNLAGAIPDASLFPAAAYAGGVSPSSLPLTAPASPLASPLPPPMAPTAAAVKQAERRAKRNRIKKKSSKKQPRGGKPPNDGGLPPAGPGLTQAGAAELLFEAYLMDIE
ncbi:unnamed protein product, partial [Symbiodinium sp. KB8]